MSERILARLADIEAEAAELHDELNALADLDELDDEQEARFDELTDDDSPIFALRDEKATLEKRLKVLEAAGRPKAVEVGEDRSVQFMKQTNRQVDIRTASRAEVRDAARAILEDEHKGQKVSVSDAAATHIDLMFGRKAVSEDGETLFDGDGLARRFIATEKPAYRSAFQKAMASPTPAWDADEIAAVNEVRAAEQSLTSASGGYAVPVLIDPTVILTSGAGAAPLLDVARIEYITNNIWKGVSSAGVAWATHSEMAEVSAVQATLAQPTVTPETAAAYVPFSVEIQGDWPTFATSMQTLIAQGYLDFLAAETAIGSAGLVGIFTAIDATAASEVTPTTDGALGPVDALKVWNALPERFKGNATWFMDVTVESQLRNASALGGLYTTDLSTGGIGPLLGKRVILSDYAPNFTGTTGASNLAILGDFRNFVVAQRVGMTMELIPQHVGANGLPTLGRGYLAWARVGSDSVADEAFRLLQNQ